MEQASYYLDQSREGGSYSLALIGERASGKTSLLNALETYASATGLIAAQVRLDEGVASDDLEFFREVFHSLMATCAENNLFGGEAGVEYDTFRRQILTHDLDTEPANEPLAFGRVYATARTQDRGIALSRRMLREDFDVIVEQCRSAGVPAVVLILDECDVLADNHALLQALRNLLMDSRNFSIVAAGTEKMFPAISEVFSPVPRQFVRINVGPFQSWKDTRKAILRRLMFTGQDWAVPVGETCREIHELTQGRPYEVMLVSHFAYRERTRERQRVPMSLSPEVMGAVANQLEQQDPSVQDTMNTLRGLNPVDAETIRELIPLDGQSINRFAVARLGVGGTYEDDAFEVERQEIIEILTSLSRTGFVSTDGNVLKVDANSFQRALIKYVVLGQRDPGDAPARPLLPDPRHEIASKVTAAIEGALRDTLSSSVTSGLIAELHIDDSSDDPPVSFNLAFSDQFQADEYSVQASCRFSAVGSWLALFVFRIPEAGRELRDEMRKVLEAENQRLEDFNVSISDIEIVDVDREALASYSKEEVDPINELALDAAQAFLAGSQDLRGRVDKACVAVLKSSTDDDFKRRTLINNLAFMALGVEDSESYEELTARLEGLGDPPILAIATRALWVATQGRYKEALESLRAIDPDGAEDEERVHIWMYSPSVLARESPAVGYDDLVGKVDLADLLQGYTAAVSARQEGNAVSDALAAIEDAPPWLLGAAADAAAHEGRVEFERELRRRAADRVDGIDD